MSWRRSLCAHRDLQQARARLRSTHFMDVDIAIFAACGELFSLTTTIRPARLKDLSRETKMADNSAHGRFVWHELITPDTDGAQAFYSKTLGWKTQAWERDPSYTMFLTSGGPLGGTVGKPSEAARWLPYIGTDRIEDTVDQARSLGARVLSDVTELPNGGKYAVLEDPQGAAFGVYASSDGVAPEAAAGVGEYSWHELATDDYRAAFEFYSALFGWEETGQHEMGGPLGVYFMFGREGQAFGGMFTRTPEIPGPSWLGYVRVKDIDKTVKSVTAAGGTLVSGPIEVPGGDLIAQFTDPQGAMFAVHMLASDIKGRCKSAEGSAKKAASEPSDTEAQAAATGAARREAAEEAAVKVTKQPAKKAAKKAAAQPAKAAEQAAKKVAKQPAKKTAEKTAAKKAAKKAAAKKAAAKKAAPKAAKKRPVKSTKRTVGKAAAAKRRAAPQKNKAASAKRSAKQRSAARKSARAVTKARKSSQRTTRGAAKRRASAKKQTRKAR